MKFTVKNIGVSRFWRLSVIFVGISLLGLTSIAQTQSERLKAQEFLNAGNLLLQNGNAEQAILKFTQVIETLPNLAIGYVNRGLALAAASRSNEALADADKAIELAKSGRDTNVFLAMAYQVKGHAHQALSENQKSVDAYSKAIEFQPNNPSFRVGRGLSFLYLGQFDSAINDFDKAIEIDPRLHQAYLNRALIHRRTKNYALGLSDLETAIKLNPSSALAYLNKGNIELDQKKIDEAIRSYTKAIEIEPRSDFFYNRGRAYLDRSDFEGAIRDNSEAIARNANNDKAYFNRAIAYHKVGKNDLSINDINKSLQIYDKSASRRYNLAYILFRAGRLSDALAETTALIGRFPEWKAPYVLRAIVSTQLGDLKGANRDRETAARLKDAWKPDDPDFFIMDTTIFVPAE